MTLRGGVRDDPDFPLAVTERNRRPPSPARMDSQRFGMLCLSLFAFPRFYSYRWRHQLRQRRGGDRLNAIDSQTNTSAL
jgi:hypothetical protein